MKHKAGSRNPLKQSPTANFKDLFKIMAALVSEEGTRPDREEWKMAFYIPIVFISLMWKILEEGWGQASVI